MNREDTLILALCRNDQKKAGCILQDRAIHWPSFYKSIKQHKIVPLILHRLQDYELPQPEKKTIKTMYKRSLISTMEDHTILKKEWERINTLFTNTGIECLLLKGLTLNSSYHRIIGDLDILIRKRDLVQAAALLVKNGYINATGSLHPYLSDSEKKNSLLSMYWNNEFQFYNKDNGLIIELHINLFQHKRVFIEDLSLFLENVEIFWSEKSYSEKFGGYVLSKENLLLLYCLHTAIKRAPGKNTFILRNVVDIHLLINEHPCWDTIIDKALFLKITPFLYFSLLLTRKLMKTDIPCNVLRGLRNGCSKEELFLVRIHLRCVKNLARSSLLYSLIYRILSSFVFNTDPLQKLKWSLFIPIFAPSRHKLANDFKLDINSPLIYFAYIVNPFRLLYAGIKYILLKRG